VIEKRSVKQEASASDVVNREAYKGMYTLNRAEHGYVVAQALAQAVP
jgi:hypothetical protein